MEGVDIYGCFCICLVDGCALFANPGVVRGCGLLRGFFFVCAFCVLCLSLFLGLDFVVVFVETICLLKSLFTIDLLVFRLNLFGGFYVAFFVV